MTLTRKRTDSSLSQKIDTVRLVQNKKLLQIEIAKRFNCSQSTVSNIVKKKDDVMKEAEDNRVPNHKQSDLGMQMM